MLADMTWNTVYTVLKSGLSKKYPALSYTASEMNKTEPKLPNLFVNQMDAPSVGNDLERNKQNGINSVIQLEVSSSTSLNEARDIINAAGDIVIKMGYSITSGPLQSNTSVYRMIARCSRIVGDGDLVRPM